MNCQWNIVFLYILLETFWWTARVPVSLCQHHTSPRQHRQCQERCPQPMISPTGESKNMREVSWLPHDAWHCQRGPLCSCLMRTKVFYITGRKGSGNGWENTSQGSERAAGKQYMNKTSLTVRSKLWKRTKQKICSWRIQWVKWKCYTEHHQQIWSWKSKIMWHERYII